MEPQPQDKEQHHPRTSAPSNTTTTSNTRSLPTNPSISTSVPVLRFPRPQGSRRLANWVSSSSPDIVQLPTMSDTNSLTDSSYEIISGPGTVSYEPALTESTGSLGAAPRPDDVHSLDGSEGQYETDSDEGEESDASSRASSIRYADQVLQNPSSILPTNNHNIELQTVREKAGYTQGQHTIRGFSEEETEALAKDFGIVDPPKRMNASIVLDMADGGLSLEEPLGILYVGPSEPKRDIILKLGSAIWASPANSTETTFARHREGVYNLVPISSFGPTPELDLMEASQYQIKVDHCTSISRKTSTGTSDARPDQYSLTFGHDAHYDISLSPFAAHPQWSPPHIAIFFVAQDDNDEDRDTRDLAVKFVSQLGIPSIFISDSHSFVKPTATGAWVGGALTAGPHISLGSCDPQEPMRPVRLPIDFTSFTNLDPRQMNRNLAHLTGMVEPPKSAAVDLELDENLEGKKGKGIDWSRLREAGAEFYNEYQSLSLVAVSLLFSVIFSFLAVFIQVLLVPAWSNQADVLSGAPAISPHTTPVVTVTSTSLKAHTSTTTVVINVTSTKTVDLGRSQPSTSTLASALSFAGFLSDKPSSTPVERLCSAHVHRPNEILVRLPPAIKERCLSKKTVAINVWRREVPLEVSFSSVDEGILISLGQSEAYGQLNVTVVATKKPKINETLLVDFGRPKYAEAVSAGFQALYDLAKVVCSTTNDAVQMVEDTCAPAAAKLRGEAIASIKDQIYEAGKAAQGCYEESIDRVKRSLVPNEMNKFLQKTKVQLSRHIKTAQELREEFDKSVLQAQIGSRLWWLKLRGKTDEYAEYQRNASRLLKSILSTKEKKDSPEKPGYIVMFGKRRYQQNQGAAMKSQNAIKDNRWKRKIMG